MITAFAEGFTLGKYIDIIIIIITGFKTKSDTKSSNFSLKWTKFLYQNNFKNITAFFHFQKAKDINIAKITPKTIFRENSRK